MRKITKHEFYKILKDTGKFEDIEIDFSQIELKEATSVFFTNCNFTHSQILFVNSDSQNEKFRQKTIQFDKCSFINCLFMNIDDISSLAFFNINKASSLKINTCKIDHLVFQNNININYGIEINFCEIYETFQMLDNVFSEKGSLNFLHNNFDKPIVIKNNVFYEVNFSKTIFNDFFLFENIFEGKLNSKITSCIFNKVNFSDSKFTYLSFSNCDFLETTWFENCKNSIFSDLKFIACKFSKYSLFDNSFFNKIDISHTKFEEKVSFENFETNKFILHQVSFLSQAYFNDLNKKNEISIENWDRKTLNAIKRELANSHNQIDYLRFKAYELEAFKKEENYWKDKFILKLNSISTKNGLDWFKGLKFTLIISFCFFYLYSTIEVYNFGTNPFEYSFISTERTKEFFFFLNPSDFDYHFDKLKDNKTNIGATIIFILAKIFIGYGIYQTIQAFRKFGVNGG